MVRLAVTTIFSVTTAAALKTESNSLRIGSADDHSGFVQMFSCFQSSETKRQAAQEALQMAEQQMKSLRDGLRLDVLGQKYETFANSEDDFFFDHLNVEMDSKKLAALESISFEEVQRLEGVIAQLQSEMEEVTQDPGMQKLLKSAEKGIALKHYAKQFKRDVEKLQEKLLVRKAQLTLNDIQKFKLDNANSPDTGRFIVMAFYRFFARAGSKQNFLPRKPVPNGPASVMVMQQELAEQLAAGASGALLHLLKDEFYQGKGHVTQMERQLKVLMGADLWEDLHEDFLIEYCVNDQDSRVAAAAKKQVQDEMDRIRLDEIKMTHGPHIAEARQRNQELVMADRKQVAHLEQIADQHRERKLKKSVFDKKRQLDAAKLQMEEDIHKIVAMPPLVSPPQPTVSLDIVRTRSDCAAEHRRVTPTFSRPRMVSA